MFLSGKSFALYPRGNANPDYTITLSRLKHELESFLSREKQKYFERGMKFHISLKVRYHVIKNEQIVDKPEYHFTAKARTCLHVDEIAAELEPILERLECQIRDQSERGSGFVYTGIDVCNLSLVSYTPYKGGSYIPIEKHISAKHAILNIQTKDDKCILDAICAVLHPCQLTHPERAYHYEKF